MSDVVVTVPMGLWRAWIEEGDLPGERWTQFWWHFYVGGSIPKIPGLGEPEDPRWASGLFLDTLWRSAAPEIDIRCYIVAHGKLRGYSPLRFIEVARPEDGGRLKAFVRTDGATAVTITTPIRGFQGWRYRWWDRSMEKPFPEWRTP